MNDNSFKIRINTEAARFLDTIGLLKSNIFKLPKKIARENFEYGRSSDYKTIFNRLTQTSAYDFLLNDDSIFQFQKQGEDYRYLFMQSFRRKVSFPDFLCNLDIDVATLNSSDYNYLYSHYEQGIDESLFDFTSNPIYIRYDVSHVQYKEGTHPYSHMHIGLNNELRIPLSLLLTPEMFVLFCVKMVYPEVWIKFMSENQVREMMASFKSKCEKVDGAFWSSVDMQELYLV